MRSWYCVQTLPRQEPLAREGLERRGITVFLPSFLVKHRNRHISVQPLFPGYLFASFDSIRDFNRVNYCEGVTRILTHQNSLDDYKMPEAIAAAEIEGLRAQALGFDQIKRTGARRRPPQQVISAGCYVRILSGPLAGDPTTQRALVEWTDGKRATLLLTIFNRQTRAEFFQKDLEIVP